MESDQKSCVILQIDQPELELSEMTSNFTLPPHQPSNVNSAGALWNKKKKTEEKKDGYPDLQNPDHIEIENLEDPRRDDKKKNTVKELALKTEQLFQKGQQVYKKGAEIIKKNEKLIETSKQAYDIYRGMVREDYCFVTYRKNWPKEIISVSLTFNSSPKSMKSRYIAPLSSSKATNQGQNLPTSQRLFRWNKGSNQCLGSPTGRASHCKNLSQGEAKSQASF